MVIVTHQHHFLNMTMESVFWCCFLAGLRVLTSQLSLFSVGPAYRCDNHTEFSCKTNYRCVPQWAVCNGADDCRDNSDEQGCGRRHCREGEGTRKLKCPVPLLDEWISHVVFSLFTSEKGPSIDSSNNMLYFGSILQSYWGSLIYSILNEISPQRML